jgi:diaminohydroxyphosphoribosylaminopyrimidine deaminase/5-amino-6-(5-phosphoribosylamino)uracil reductase
VIVNGGIVGRGWHKKAGEPHAEINALGEAGKRARGATMYVTLEPCCHWGKTGPCTKAIISAGIRRVVAAMRDPNTKVCGKGCEELEKAGVKVEVGVLEKEAKELNEAFEKYITTCTPFVLIKAALSVDGKMAPADEKTAAKGSAKPVAKGTVWISGEESRRMVHRLRDAYDAVMVGANTVIKDDPLLTCRMPGGRNPVRVVIDSVLKVPLDSKVFNSEAGTIVFTTGSAPKGSIDGLRKKGVEVVVLRGKRGQVDLKEVMKELGARGIISVMIEGGPTLISAALDAGVTDKVMLFIAPKVVGSGVGIELGGARDIWSAIRLEGGKTENVGEDLLITAYVRR